MAKKLTWSMLTLPPINLRSLPKQDVDYEELVLDLQEVKHWRGTIRRGLAADIRKMTLDNMCVEHTYIMENEIKARMKTMELIYFCRNGRYPDES